MHTLEYYIADYTSVFHWFSEEVFYILSEAVISFFKIQMYSKVNRKMKKILKEEQNMSLTLTN